VPIVLKNSFSPMIENSYNLCLTKNLPPLRAGSPSTTTLASYQRKQVTGALSPQRHNSVDIATKAGNPSLPKSTGDTDVDAATAATVEERFSDVVTTASELRRLVGPANRWFTSKMLQRLDRRCRGFIAASPFVVVGSTNPLGMVDLSPKGDRPGFVRFLDDATLAIPDRRGNRRVDTFHNVLQNPGVGLIFFVPGQRETLRVTGRAVIVRDHDIRSTMVDNGRMPELAMIVLVEGAFFHCGKCITRSNLWEYEGDLE
jgi:PPOX class probable FMN-dependent enzyme